jgi:hypothetical protein
MYGGPCRTSVSLLQHGDSDNGGNRQRAQGNEDERQGIHGVEASERERL